MKIVSWNIKRTERKDFRSQLKLLFHSHNPVIIILMETRINIKKAYSIGRLCGWNLVDVERLFILC